MATLKTSAAQEAAPVTPAAAAGYRPENLRDAAYMGAHSAETLASCAMFLRDIQPNVVDSDITEDNMKQLKDGWAVRYAERFPGDLYMVKEGKYIPLKGVKTEDIPKGTETAFFTLGVALGYTTHAFGQLGQSEPEKHSIIKKWREDFQKYVSNRKNEMLSIIRKDAAAGKTQKRVTNDWTASAKKMFDALKDQRKNKAAKGDTSAPPEAKLKAAIEAFYAALAAE